MSDTPINDFAPADDPSHPSNHPGPGAPVRTSETPWALAHLLDPEKDAGGVSEMEMLKRANRYDDLLFEYGSNTELDAFTVRSPGHDPGADPGYPTLRELEQRAATARRADEEGADPATTGPESTEDRPDTLSGKSEVDAGPESDAKQDNATVELPDEEAELAAALARLDGK